MESPAGAQAVPSGTAGLEKRGEAEVGFQPSKSSELFSASLDASLARPDALVCISPPCVWLYPWDGLCVFSPSSVVIHGCFLPHGSAVHSY